MPRVNIRIEQDLDEFYSNPEITKSADSFLGRITEHQTEAGLDSSKEEVVRIALQIMKVRVNK